MSQLTSLTRLGVWDHTYLSATLPLPLQPSHQLRHLELHACHQGFIELNADLARIAPRLETLHLDSTLIPNMLQALQQLSSLKVGVRAFGQCRAEVRAVLLACQAVDDVRCARDSTAGSAAADLQEVVEITGM
jgi:hypothetical protein